MLQEHQAEDSLPLRVNLPLVLLRQLNQRTVQSKAQTKQEIRMSKTAPVLSKVTTQYDPVQDRIRLSGQFKNDKICVIWLTQRLLNRLIPHVTGWLEKQQDDNTPRGDLLNSIQQQRAKNKHAERVEQGLDTAVSADEAETEWLAQSLDIQLPASGVRVIFKDKAKEAEQMAVLELSPLLIRQWLNVLMANYKKAEWSHNAWPEWMQEQIEPNHEQQAPKALH